MTIPGTSRVKGRTVYVNNSRDFDKLIAVATLVVLKAKSLKMKTATFMAVEATANLR